MKALQKLILPALFLVVIITIYIIYFASSGLGKFSDFDINNNATKDIVVEYVKEQGLQKNAQAGTSSFYARDKDGKVVLVQGPIALPDGFENSSSIVLKGHLHKDFFHAHEVELQ